jgi:methionine sulfoxide reductase heme-binding subunit
VLAASSPALWYLTRATGLVSLLLLTGSVVLGIIGANRLSTPRWPRLVTGGLHKNLSMLAVAFLAVHIVTAVTDSFVTITWLNVVVPLTGTYRPVWLGLGAVASDLLIALIVTSIARRHIGYRAWRLVHWAAYACWPVALVHGLGTGTDARQPWAIAVFLGSLALVCGATWWRIRGDLNVPIGHRRAAALAASIGLPVVILGWIAGGPLQPGWAARARTPAPITAPIASTPAPAVATQAPVVVTEFSGDD